MRDYGVGAQILLDLGIKDMILLSNTKRTIVGLEGWGLHFVERVPMGAVLKWTDLRDLGVKLTDKEEWLGQKITCELGAYQVTEKATAVIQKAFELTRRSV